MTGGATTPILLDPRWANDRLGVLMELDQRAHALANYSPPEEEALAPSHTDRLDVVDFRLPCGRQTEPRPGRGKCVLALEWA